MKEVQEGSRSFKKVQDGSKGSRWFKRVKAVMPNKVQEGLRRFRKMVK